MAQKYYVGLDMGTASVGYAVTDDKYNIIKIGRASCRERV